MSSKTSTRHFGRRDFIAGAGAFAGFGALGGCTPARIAQSRFDPVPELALVRAHPDRINRITVCTRPFRAQGPRFDVETIGQKTVIHNYGHGGSGWSLSWGSADIAVRNAIATGASEVAVIGAGAIGLTSALTAQRAGLKVTIYAKDWAPQTRSSNATGVWSPDSRICLEAQVTPAFAKLWEEMCRASFTAYQTLLGLPGRPIEWFDSYFLSDIPFREAEAAREAKAARRYAELENRLTADLTPRSEELPPASHPFHTPYVRRSSTMMFNITAYSQHLTTEFLLNGGRKVTREFRTPSDYASLAEKTVINCPGYGARALFQDDSIIPVRGQLARLIPQPEVDYGLFYDGSYMIPRRDGLVAAYTGADGDLGYGDDTVVPDRVEAEAAVAGIAKVMARMKRPS